jgi:hypothetical protein
VSLDASTLHRPVLHLDLCATQGPEMHLDMPTRLGLGCQLVESKELKTFLQNCPQIVSQESRFCAGSKKVRNSYDKRQQKNFQ